MRVHLKNEAGMVKEAKIGFSWTTLIFGYWVPLLRRDYKIAGLMFLLVVIIGVIVLTNPALLWVSWGTWILDISMAFVYNKMHIQGLQAKGFKPATEADNDILLSNGFNF